jgi:hypothetical protein
LIVVSGAIITKIMKTTLKHCLIPLTVLWALITTAHPEMGPTPLPAGKQIVGHIKKSENIIKEATDVVVGYFIKLGGAPGGDSDYQSYIEGAEIKVISTMKGHLSGKVEVRYNMFNKPGPHEEGRPDLGV